MDQSDQISEELDRLLAEIEDYKRENARYAEALQIIADGKGKYAKVARDAL